VERCDLECIGGTRPPVSTTITFLTSTFTTGIPDISSAHTPALPDITSPGTEIISSTDPYPATEQPFPRN